MKHFSRVITPAYSLLAEMNAKIAALEGRSPYSPKAIVGLDRFCEILAGPVSHANMSEQPDLGQVFQHPIKDIGKALAEQGRFTLASQGQVQSLFGHYQFLQWLDLPEPGLIFVDANIDKFALDSLSPVSVFCATFVTSMMEVRPDDALAYFFCGLHALPGDAWYGPNGLVRSLIVQLLMKLVDMDREMARWNLDFINHSDYLWELERHDLHSLCIALHSLLYEFPPGMTVYCIIDSVSRFDVDRLFEDLALVMDCLEAVIEDDALPATVKVLLTNPSRSTLRVKQLPVISKDPSRLLSLSEHYRNPMAISTRVIEGQLLRRPSPAPPLRKPNPIGQEMEYWEDDGYYQYGDAW